MENNNSFNDKTIEPQPQSMPDKPVYTLPSSKSNEPLNNNEQQPETENSAPAFSAAIGNNQPHEPNTVNLNKFDDTTHHSDEITDEQIRNLKEAFTYYKLKNNYEYAFDNQKRKNSKAIIVALITISALIIALSIYCIASDVGSFSNYSPYNHNEASNNASDSDNVQFLITSQNKPDVDDDYVDENGKYTVEGVAQLMLPSIVEIFTYNDNFSSYDYYSSGSGIVISTDGYIITNAHIFENSDSFEVVMNDGTRYDGQMIGEDAKSDIAVIKISASDLQTAVLGNSDEVVIGEQVVAIGNPCGFSGSVTDGIVSGINRPVKTSTTGIEMNCIQTNAAISPGNSGGALVNMYGQVIGITSSKYVSSDYDEGLGFAITINNATPIIEDLISQGYVPGRTRIGILFYPGNDTNSETVFENEFGYKKPDVEGIIISQISDDCDITNTDLQPGDFIVSVDGNAVYDYDTLSSAINGKAVGDTVTADVVRVDKNGKRTEFTIKFKLMEDTTAIQ